MTFSIKTEVRPLTPAIQMTPGQNSPNQSTGGLQFCRANGFGLRIGAGYKDGLKSRKNQADGGGGGNVAGGPIGRWCGVPQPVLIETGGGDLLHAAVTHQNIPGPRWFSI
jgi:hypothetical protein